MARLDIEIQDKIDGSLVSTIKELNGALSQLEKLRKSGGSKSAIASELDEERLASARLTRETKEIRKELAALSLEKRKSGQSANVASGAYDEARIRLSQLGKEIKSAGGSFDLASNSLKELTPELQAQIDEYNKLNDALKAFDAQMGNHQRQVGNYAIGLRGASGVTMEFNRIIQDAPFGMMGIGNNIQQLTSNWQAYVQSSRAAATATGQTVTTMGLLKGVMASMLSPANLLTLAIAALTSGIVIYQRWQHKKNKEMENGADVARDYAKELNNVSTALYKASQAYYEDITRLNTLMAVVKDVTASVKARRQALNELQSMYPNVFRNFDLETIKTNEAKSAYDELTKSIIAAARARAAESRIAEKSANQFALDEQNKALEKQNKELQRQIELNEKSRNTPGQFGGVGAIGSSPETIRQANIYGEIVSKQKDIKKNDETINTNLLERAKIQEEINELSEIAISNTKEVNASLLEGGSAAENIAYSLEKITSIGESKLFSSSRLILSGTEAEIQKVRDEYAKLYADIDKEEKELLSEHKGNEQKRMEIMKVASDQRAKLLEAEKLEVNSVIYNQDTESLKKSLSEQYELWKSYEEWRKATSEQYANERYANELDAIHSFEADLQRNIATLIAKGLTMQGLNQDEQKRLNDLMAIYDKFYKEQLTGQDKYMINLINANKSVNQKRMELAEQYNKDIANLDKKGAEERTRRYMQDLRKSIEDEVNALTAMQDLNVELNLGTVKMARSAARNARTALDEWFGEIQKGADENAKEIAKSIMASLKRNLDDIDVNLDKENFDIVADLASSFVNLVESSLDFKGNIDDTLRTMTSMIGVVGNIASTLGNALKNANLSGLGAGLGIGATVFGGLLGVFSSINANIQRKEQERIEKINQAQLKANQMQVKAMEAITNSLSRQLSLIEEIYGVQRVEEWYRVSSEAAEKFNKTIADMATIVVGGGNNADIIDAVRAMGLNTVEQMKAERDRLEKWKKSHTGFDKSWKENIARLEALNKALNLVNNGTISKYHLAWQNIEDITQEGIEHLRRDIESGIFDDVTEGEMNSLLKYAETYMDAQRRLMEEFTGTTLESMVSNIRGLFKLSGKTSAEEWAESFEKIIEDALLQMFSRQFLEDRVKTFYDMLAKMAEDGLTQSEIEQARDWYNRNIKEAGEAWMEGVRQVLPEDIAKPVQGGGVASQISRAITEDTALRLEGIWRGSYDQLILQTELLRSMLSELGASTGGFGRDLATALNGAMAEVSGNTLRIADNTEYLKDIDETLVLISDGVRQVAKNTSQQSSRDLGK